MWFIHSGIDPDWLLEQALRMLRAGFAPNTGYGIAKWLGEIAPSQPDKAVEALSELLNSPHLAHWTVTTERAAIRAILETGLKAGTQRRRSELAQVVSLLATRRRRVTSTLSDLRQIDRTNGAVSSENFAPSAFKISI